MFDKWENFNRCVNVRPFSIIFYIICFHIYSVVVSKVIASVELTPNIKFSNRKYIMKYNIGSLSFDSYKYFPIILTDYNNESLKYITK